TRLTQRLRDDDIHRLRLRHRDAWIDRGHRRWRETRHDIQLETAAHGDEPERKILLRPGPIEFHPGRFDHTLRTHVADNADDVRGRTRAGDQQRLSDRVLVGEDLLCTGLADQHDVLATREVVFVEVATGQHRNAPGLEVAGSDVVTRSRGTLVHRRNLEV